MTAVPHLPCATPKQQRASLRPLLALLAAGWLAQPLPTLAALTEGERPPSRGFGLSFSFQLPLFGAEPEHEPGELLVLWPDAEAAQAGVAAIEARHQLRPVQIDDLSALGAVMAQYQTGSTRRMRQVLRDIRHDMPDVVVDLNTTQALLAGAATPADAPAEPATPRLWALQQLGLSATPSPSSARAADVKIGVVDTAFDADLPLETGPRLVRDWLSPDDVAAPCDHGNAIAQLIAAPALRGGFSGAARGVQLVWASTMRMVGGRPKSNTALIARAVDWLAGQQVNVINISQGGAGDEVLKAVFVRLLSRPVLVLAAAGNGGPRADPVFPAAYPGVIAVTALDAAARVYASANQGSYVGLAAPGVDVWVPQPGAASAMQGQYLSGTSFASALATASLAQAEPGLWRLPRALQVAELCNAARDLGAPGTDAVFGCGLLRLPVSTKP